MIRRTVVGVLLVTVLAGCGDDGGSGAASRPTTVPPSSPAASATASDASDASVGVTLTWSPGESSGTAPAGRYPNLPQSELPELAGYEYVPLQQSEQLEPPPIAHPPAIEAVALAAVAKRGDPMPGASVEVVRLKRGLADDELDGVVTRMAKALGGDEPKTSRLEGETVRTVGGLPVAAVVFHRGDDVVLVFSPDAAEARRIATAYLAAT
jgi:hypothetical protein